MIATILSVAASTTLPFRDVSADSGIGFVQHSGAIGERWLPEIMGGGVALIDFDRDGDLDVYLVQGRSFDPTVPGPSDRLYRNDGGLRFTDVTDAAGIASFSDYGMGAAVGDFDGDGWDDIYVTNLGPNRLLRNDRHGGFVDVTAAAGVDDDRMSLPATFFDMDADGDLDLFVGAYLQWSLALHKPCRSNASALDYCSPKVFRPEVDRLFENLGDGTFRNVTIASGMNTAFGPALGVVAADLDGDGRLDLYVANDGAANQLWLNQGGGRFRNEALIAGVALNMDGLAEASMGIDAGDADGDGDTDLFMTHLSGETNTLYVNAGDGFFDDRSATTGMATPSAPLTGFGTRFIDYDGDGDLDVFVTNGGVMLISEQLARGDDMPLRMPSLLLQNDGSGRFADVTAAAGPALTELRIGRGLATGDLDDDGDPDLIVTSNGGPVQVLENIARDNSSWVGIDLRDGAGAAVSGARVALRCGDLNLVRSAQRDGSYLSAGDPRVLFGLADRRGNCDASVRWPDGRTTQHAGLAIGQYHRIERP